MFLGVLPTKMATQIASAVDFNSWGKVFVGCSGTFRGEQIVNSCAPDVPVYSNDISLLSCSIGYALVGKKLDVRFKGEAEFLNKYTDTPLGVSVAVEIALLFGSFKTTNECFYAGDFLDQIERAKNEGGGFMCFAPTYKGGYERQYKYLDSVAEWNQPSYTVWDPKNIASVIHKCIQYDIPYLVVSDHLIEDTTEKPTLLLMDNGRPVYAYTKGRSSLRVKHTKFRPFKYKVVNPQLLTKDSVVEVIPVKNDLTAFLKTIYLAKGINFVSGMANYLIRIDGMIAGAFTYSQSKYGNSLKDVYLLSDFSLSRERKISKLIALLATSRTVINDLNKKWFTNLDTVFTTAFTNKPVSMKYRGIFEIYNRKEGQLNYKSSVREQTPQELYVFWWDRYGKKA